MKDSVKKLSQYLGLVSFMLISGHADALDFFVGIDGVRTKVEVADVSYNPSLVRARIGALLNSGVGFELNIADTIKSDDAVGLEVGLESHYAAMLRLQSPYKEVLSVYVNLGYGVSELSVVDGGAEQLEELESPFFSIGFQRPFEAYPRISYFGEFSRIYEDQNVEISGLSFGYQFNF